MKFQLFVMCCVLQSIYGARFNLDLSKPAINPLIVGGDEASDGYAPHQCSIQINRKHYCGCSIISKNWILTAGHCLQGKSAEDLEFMVGSNDVRSGTYYKAERLIVHANYSDFSNDIALVRVMESITFTLKVQPIELATEEIADGTALELTGWGYKRYALELPRCLQILEVAVFNEAECVKAWAKRAVKVGENHICTFRETGKGACKGDSGSPLVLREGSSVKLVGIANFAYPCAHGFPDGFAKVSYFLDWIKSNTD